MTASFPINFPSITIAVLLYGNYPQLAKRCLGSIHKFLINGGLGATIRVGLNECCRETEQYVEHLVATGVIYPQHVFGSTANLRKYPMMQRMIHGPNDFDHVSDEYVMWFDDDSFVENESLLQGLTAGFGNKWAVRRPDMIGAPYTIALNANQAAWIKDQPWYTGRPIPEKPSKLSFATGGWWMAKTAVLRKFGYPFPDLNHNGGDVMLGALIAQQGLSLDSFRQGVAINADDKGRESHAPRRGVSEKPLGFGYVAKKPAEPPPAPKPKWTATLDL